MRSIIAATLIFLATAYAHATGARIESVETYRGMCEASGAVALPEGSFGDRFLMLNNEDNILRIYAVGTPEAPVEKNIGDAIGLSSRNRDDMDLEAATWLDGQAILVGSLGRNNDGEVREARWQFLSVAVEGDVVTTPKGRSDKLLAALAALDPDFAAAIGDLTRDDADLSPKKAGINLEGMSVAADGASLFLGFRNPVPKGQSVLVKLLNPKAVLFQEADPAFAPPIRLDLGGLGIRSLEYSPAAGAYFIVAGPIDSGADFDIYRWVEGAEPAPVPGAREALASLGDFAPEGLIIDKTGKRLQLFSDNEACADRDVPERDPDAGIGDHAAQAVASSRSTTLSCSFGSVRAISALAGAFGRVERLVRDAGRDVDEVAGSDVVEVLQLRPMAERRLALEHVDRRLVGLVVVRLGLGARRHDEEVHADRLRAGQLGRDTGEIVEPLLAVIGRAAPDHLAFRHRFPPLQIASGRLYGVPPNDRRALWRHKPATSAPTHRARPATSGRCRCRRRADRAGPRPSACSSPCERPPSYRRCCRRLP